MTFLVKPNMILFVIGIMVLSTALTIGSFIKIGWTYWMGYFLLPLNLVVIGFNIYNYKNSKKKIREFLEKAVVVKIPNKIWGKCNQCFTIGSMEYVLVNKDFAKEFHYFYLKKGKFEKNQWGAEVICKKCALQYSI